MILLLLGTFMDMGPTIIIVTPIFLPVAQAYGIDPVHFGVIMILNLGIGLNTPPVGAVQFVACAVGKISVWEAMRSIWPFYGAGLVVLAAGHLHPGAFAVAAERLQIGNRMADRRSPHRTQAQALRARRRRAARQVLGGEFAAGPEAADRDAS